MPRFLGAVSTSDIKHAITAFLAYHSVLSDPGRLALCLLATLASNAILGYQPDRHSPYSGRYHIPYSLLSRAGRSLEIACYLVHITTRFGMLALGLWLLLLGARALHRYVPHRDVPYSIWRRFIGVLVLRDGNRAVEVVWVMQVVWALWAIIPTGWFRSASLWIGPLVGILIVLALLYDPMCALQDRISERRIRRARGADGNTRNAATCLPVEVQLVIFDLLRTRGHFGVHEHLPGDTRVWYLNNALAFSSAADLAAAARVCTAWCAPATEALYHDAVLPSARSACKFSRALALRPELAQLVRRVVLPESGGYAPPANGRKTRGMPWLEFSAAIEHIFSCCVDAVDIQLFRERTLFLTDIPGFRSASSHVSHLAIHCKISGNISHTDHEPEVVDVPQLLGFVPHLTSLTLTSQKLLFDSTTLQEAHRPVLTGIQELCLGSCKMDVQHLAHLLRHLPNLRVAELRNTEFSGGIPPERIALSSLFAAQRSTLVDLRIRFDRGAPSLAFSGLTALRSLTVTAAMLSTVQSLPPRLEELVVSFTPYSYKCRDHSAFRRTLLDAVRALRALAPGLSAVQLWDDVSRAQLGQWAVVAFMLRAMLAPAGVAVAVNLRIGYTDAAYLKEKFGRQKALRRIMWSGVF